ncbi:MAG: hypothetical protein RLZZ399_1905 [Verrucomicrobiota bacterium]|jgi:sugar phosphate isomerase/epimerase
MKLPAYPALHLTYCQNIHPGETWAEHYGALEQKAVEVKSALGYSGPFGLGLRLSAQAAEELQDPQNVARGAALFARHNLYPFSINGFPYGRFHRGPVKENVYAPDWRTPERFEYTVRLANVLAQWLPEGQEGSISTVPGSFGAWIRSSQDKKAMATQLGRVAAELADLERRTGRRIHLGLEPEPDCFLETTAQTLEFFAGGLPEGAIPQISDRLGVSSEAAEVLLRRHIGVCFDTCHVALQYENLADSIRSYRDAGILISKIQISAALKAPAGEAARQALLSFAEPTYLHQVKARTDVGTCIAWSDLPIALEEMPAHPEIEEIRVHFHVPLFVAPQIPLESTASALDADFWVLVKSGICPHLEIETYTFDVLPPEVRPQDVVSSVAAEYRWVLDQISDRQVPST